MFGHVVMIKKVVISPGINQVNIKVNKEQIRILFSVYDKNIVVWRVFKKTSPQIEHRAYELALSRKKQAEQFKVSGNELPTIQ